VVHATEAWDEHLLKVCRYVERNSLLADPFDKLRAGPSQRELTQGRLCTVRERLAACGIAQPSEAATPDERVLPEAAEPLDEWPVPESWLERHAEA